MIHVRICSQLGENYWLNLRKGKGAPLAGDTHCCAAALAFRCFLGVAATHKEAHARTQDRRSEEARSLTQAHLEAKYILDYVS